MNALLGATLGLITGMAVWLVSRGLVIQYRSKPKNKANTAIWQLPGEEGSAISQWATLTLAMAVACGAFLGWQADRWEHLAAGLLITGMLLAIGFVDLRVRRIPNALVLALLSWAIVQIVCLGMPSAMSAALGVIVAGGPFLLLALLRPGAMGWGDVKLAAALGALLGIPFVLLGLVWGIVVAGMVAVLLLGTRKAGRKTQMAYGPYLALGGWLAWVASMGLNP